MTLTIWKYVIKIEDEQELGIPSPAIPLSFQLQDRLPTLWCLVDREKGMVWKKFRLAGTGHLIKNSLEELKYIGTVQIWGGRLVYHLFEIVS